MGEKQRSYHKFIPPRRILLSPYMQYPNNKIGRIYIPYNKNLFRKKRP